MFPALPGRFLATETPGKSKNCGLKLVLRTSLVVQWFEIHLPMQGTWVQFLVQEDSTCHVATQPMHHTY